MRRAIILLSLATACGAPAPPAATPCTPRGLTSVGEALPDCSFDGPGGARVDLSALRGKPALLNFWASWCVACVKEMHDFQRVFVSLGSQVHIVGFDLDGILGETRAAAERFVDRTGVTYPIAFDTGGLLYAHFSARPTLPETVFVDAEGIVRERRIGQLTEKELRARIAEHFGISSGA